MTRIRWMGTAGEGCGRQRVKTGEYHRVGSKVTYAAIAIAIATTTFRPSVAVAVVPGVVAVLNLIDDIGTGCITTL